MLLTENDFKSKVMENNEMWLVIFVDLKNPGKNTKQEWDRAAMKLSGENINMGKVFSKNLARQCGVKSFPTIMYFPKGDKSDPRSLENYAGDISSNEIVTWAIEKIKQSNDGKLKLLVQI